MTRELFSLRSGLRPEQIRGQVSRDNLAVYPLGKYRLINIARLTRGGLQDIGFVYVPVPVMTPGNFSECSGIPETTIYEHLGGALPVKEVGRLRMVDIQKLFALCLAYA